MRKQRAQLQMSAGVRHRRPRPSARAFSLVEVLLAISILGVGMAMVAALFPTALKETQTSVNNVLGSMITENGLTMYKTLATQANVGTVGTLGTLNEPYAPPDPRNPQYGRYGFLARGWRGPAGNTVNDFWVNVVAYRLSNTGNYAELHQLSADVQDDPNGNVQARRTTSQLRLNTEQTWVQVGTPVLFNRPQGGYAKVWAVQGNIALLDRALPPVNGLNVYVVTEANNGNPVGTQSPAMSTLVTRAALK